MTADTQTTSGIEKDCDTCEGFGTVVVPASGSTPGGTEPCPVPDCAAGQREKTRRAAAEPGGQG